MRIGCDFHSEYNTKFSASSTNQQNNKMPIVEAHKLTKLYNNRPVVNALDLTVKTGSFTGILGPNGAGKTTTLRMFLGHCPPDSGELSVMGLPIPKQARAARADMGLVPQMDNLDPDFTVYENLVVYGRFFALTKQELAERIDKLLAFASLQDKAQCKINELSGGMRRRLTLARALINDPKLLILDEPTTGLDPQARQMIWRKLRELKKQGLTLILTTHYMEEAERLCDRVIVMDHGRILADAAPRELIRQHIELHVLEVHGDEVERHMAPLLAGAAVRYDRAGDTHFFYGDDLKPLIDRLDQQTSMHYLYRPANLEDVFIKLTGRDLRD